MLEDVQGDEESGTHDGSAAVPPPASAGAGPAAGGSAGGSAAALHYNIGQVTEHFDTADGEAPDTEGDASAIGDGPATLHFNIGQVAEHVDIADGLQVPTVSKRLRVDEASGGFLTAKRARTQVPSALPGVGMDLDGEMTALINEDADDSHQSAPAPDFDPFADPDHFEQIDEADWLDEWANEEPCMDEPEDLPGEHFQFSHNAQASGLPAPPPLQAGWVASQVRRIDHTEQRRARLTAAEMERRTAALWQRSLSRRVAAEEEAASHFQGGVIPRGHAWAKANTVHRLRVVNSILFCSRCGKWAAWKLTLLRGPRCEKARGSTDTARRRMLTGQPPVRNKPWPGGAPATQRFRVARVTVAEHASDSDSE